MWLQAILTDMKIKLFVRTFSNNDANVSTYISFTDSLLYSKRTLENYIIIFSKDELYCSSRKDYGSDPSSPT